MNETGSGLLRGLGIVGWDSREPAILAALVTEAPLLLIGPHGTAKSLLLERLAEALGLSMRHYNASMINFDDLAGFPLPDGDRVRYLRTPLDAWDAEVIFLDEIARCRVDMQNRLFALVHERRLQGARLERLRHRWAAMNPPPPPGAMPGEGIYLGCEPLDPALADRFPWVLTAPASLSELDRRAMIQGAPIDPSAANRLREALISARARFGICEKAHGEAVAAYVDVVGHALERSGLPLSNRRLRSLYEGIVAVLATGRLTAPADAARLALTWSLPQRAAGPVDEEAVLRSHKAACSLMKQPENDLLRRLLAEADPLRRIALAWAGDDDLLSVTILDARAGLPPVQRVALSARLFPLLADERPGMPGILFEALGEDVGRIYSRGRAVEQVPTHSPRYELANAISRAVASLRQKEEWIADALWSSFQSEQVERPEEVELAVDFARRLQGQLTNRHQGRAA